jgi:hypothetical protein
MRQRRERPQQAPPQARQRPVRAPHVLSGLAGTGGTRTGSAAPSGPLWGWTLPEIHAIARAAALANKWLVSDFIIRYEAAWDGIVDELLAAGERPDAHDLARAGKGAVSRTLFKDFCHTYGVANQDLYAGIGSAPQFAACWYEPEREPAEDKVTEQIALGQVMAGGSSMSSNPAATLAAPVLSVVRLADDPFAAAGDADLIGMREDLGRRLAEVLTGATVRIALPAGRDCGEKLAADVDLIVQHADDAVFGDEDGDGAASVAALARVTAVLALQPGGIGVAGRHWCAAVHEACAGIHAAPAAATPLPGRVFGNKYLRKNTSSITPARSWSTRCSVRRSCRRSWKRSRPTAAPGRRRSSTRATGCGG